MMARTPMLGNQVSYLHTRMEGLAKGFDVDVTPAQHLTGQALSDWLNSAEDVLFSQYLKDLAAMKKEREAWAANCLGGRV